MPSASCCSPWKARRNPPDSRSTSSARTDRRQSPRPSSEAVHPAHHPPSVRSTADAPSPLLRDPLLEPDAGAHAGEGVEVVEAVAEAHHGQPPFDEYEQVAVCDVARVAEVSEQTVCNYFQTKEQLVTDRDQLANRDLSSPISARMRAPRMVLRPGKLGRRRGRSDLSPRPRVIYWSQP